MTNDFIGDSEVFKKLQHIECVENKEFPELEVGKLYSVQRTIPNHVRVFGQTGAYPNRIFKAKIGSVRPEDFAGSTPEALANEDAKRDEIVKAEV